MFVRLWVVWRTGGVPLGRDGIPFHILNSLYKLAEQLQLAADNLTSRPLTAVEISRHI